MEYANALITVRYAGPTNTKGSRWIVNAKDNDRRQHVRRTICRDMGTHLDSDAHAAAQTALDALRVEVQKSALLRHDRHRVEVTAKLVGRFCTSCEFTYLARVELTLHPLEVTL
jgi:hypothetical protein